MVWLFLLKSVPFWEWAGEMFLFFKTWFVENFLDLMKSYLFWLSESVCQEVLTKPPRLQSENLKEMRYYNISVLLIRESLTSENHACITTKSLQWKLFLRCYAWRTKSFIIIERIIYMLLLESYRKAWV